MVAAFPIVGAVALGEAIFKTGEELAKFIQDAQRAPAVMANAFARGSTWKCVPPTMRWTLPTTAWRMK